MEGCEFQDPMKIDNANEYNEDLQEDQVEEENKQLTYEEFNEIYGQDGYFIDENTYFEIDLAKQKDVEFVQKCKDHKLPNCYRLDIYNVPERDESVKRFLQACLPEELKIFKFNWNSELSGISYYAESIVQAAKKATEEVYIYNFRMNVDQFTTILSSFKHATNWV